MSLSIAQSFQAQYDALHHAVAVVDRTATDARLEVSGSDRIEWLQGLLTNDIVALSPGHGCYAAYLTPQGRMIGDMRVFHRGDRVVLDVVADARATLLSRLDQFIIMEDVVLNDVTDVTGCLAVVGPQAATLLSRLAAVDGAALAGLAEYHHVPLRFDGAEGFCVASREWSAPAFDVYLPAGATSSLRAALREADVPLLDEHVRETVRIEAGRPRFGVDMDAETIPLEAGIEHRAISLTKGCYVGQEVIIRVLHRGQGRVARRLCWLVSEADADNDLAPRADPTDQARPWRAGSILRVDGKDVGRLTSVCVSPTRKRLLAIGLVHRDAAVSGTSVDVVDGGAWASARVEMLPQGPVAER